MAASIDLEELSDSEENDRNTRRTGASQDVDHILDEHNTTDDVDEMEVKFQAMLSYIANSDVSIQSQQLGDEEMSIQDKIQILTQYFSHKPIIFLERYHHVLRVEDLPCFSHLGHIYEVDFYTKEVTKRSNARTSNVRKKNRRYEALKKLECEGKYFSEEQMRSREPLMYEHYIGQYLTDEERAKMKKEIDKSDLKLSTILTEFMEEADIKSLQQKQRENEEMVEEEEESEEEEEEESEMEQDSDEPFGINDDTPGTSTDTSTSQWGSPPKRKVHIIPEEEKELLRQEFRHHMQEKFLKGNDKDFDYSQVDDNVEYDSLDIRGQDEEESYFDEEEPCEAVDELDPGSDDGDTVLRTKDEDEEQRDEEFEVER